MTGSRRRKGECLGRLGPGAAFDRELHLRLFGRPGTPYDFTGIEVHGLREKARELESQQKSMKKKVNPKAMNMIDR